MDRNSGQPAPGEAMTHNLARIALVAALLSCANASTPPSQRSTTPVPPAPPAEVKTQAAPREPAPPVLIQVPTTVGAANTTIEGCLAAATEADAQRFPPKPPTRSSLPVVTIAKVPGGLAITHRLMHACCLKGNVSTNVSGNSVIVSERLSGSPCRCMCTSALRTVVGLPPGAWRVSVDLDDRGRTQRVFSEAVSLP